MSKFMYKPCSISMLLRHVPQSFHLKLMRFNVNRHQPAYICDTSECKFDGNTIRRPIGTQLSIFREGIGFVQGTMENCHMSGRFSAYKEDTLKQLWMLRVMSLLDCWYSVYAWIGYAHVRTAATAFEVLNFLATSANTEFTP